MPADNLTLKNVLSEEEAEEAITLLGKTFLRSSSHYKNNPPQLDSDMAALKSRITSRQWWSSTLRKDDVAIGVSVVDPTGYSARGISQPGYLYSPGTQELITIAPRSKVPETSMEAMQANSHSLEWIAVDRKARREGYGMTILSQRIKEAESLNKSLVLSTDEKKACAFYHAAGLLHLATHTKSDSSERWDIFASPAPGLSISPSAYSTLRSCGACRTL